MSKKVEVKFKVVYNPGLIIRVGEFMSKCDLGIDGVEMPVALSISWKTTSKVDTAYLAKMRQAIKMSIEDDGSKVISIKKV